MANVDPTTNENVSINDSTKLSCSSKFQNYFTWCRKTTLLQIIAIFPVNIAYFSAGIGCGWVSPIVNRFRDSGGGDGDFALTTEACSWIASIHYAGRAVGCVFEAALVNRLGRNQAFVLSAVFELALWIGVLCSKSIPVHYALRFLFGLGIGMFEITAPLYIGENSSPRLRGVFGGLCIIAFYAGELVEFVVATYLPYSAIAAVNVALTAAIAASTLLLREPAHHLLATGRADEAEKRFFALRGDDDEAARKEFAETKEHFAGVEATFSLGQLGSRGVRAVTMVNCLVYLTGYPPINTMTSLILTSVHRLSPNELTILSAVVQLLAILCSSTIIERFGRRPLVLVSALISTVSHLVVAAAFVMEERGTPLPASSWIIFVFVTTYLVTVAAVFFPICTIVRGELLSPQLKPIGGCVAIIANSLLSVAITGVFLSIAQAYGMQANFLFYAAVSATLFLYVYFDLPETKGLTLTEIQKSLHK